MDGTRHTTEHRIAVVRLAILTSLLPLLWLDVIPPETRMALAGLSLLILMYIAGAIFLLPRLRRAPGRDLFLVIDIVAAAALAYFTGGINSTLLPILYLPLLAAAVQLDLRHTFLAAVAVSGILVWMWVMAEGGLPTLSPLTAKVALFTFGSLLSALLFGTLVQESRLARARLALNTVLETKLAHATAELRRRLRELEDAYGLSRRLAVATTTADVVQALLEAAAQRIGPPFAGVFLSDDGSGHLALSRVQGLPVDEAAAIMYACEDRLRRDAERPPAVARVRSADDAVWMTALCAPILSGPRVAGALCVGGDETWTAGPEAEEALAHIVSQGSVALERAYLLEDLHRLALANPAGVLHSPEEFRRALRDEIRRAARLGIPCAVVRLGVSDRTSVRSLAGRPAGQLLARQIADLVLRAVRRVDIVAMDEDGTFAMLFPMNDRKAAQEFAAGLERTIASDPAVLRLAPGGDVRFVLTVAAFPEDGASAADLDLATRATPSVPRD